MYKFTIVSLWVLLGCWIIVGAYFIYPAKPRPEVEHPEPGVYYVYGKDGKPSYIMMPNTSFDITYKKSDGTEVHQPGHPGHPTDVSDLDEKTMERLKKRTILKAIEFPDDTVAVYYKDSSGWEQWTIWTKNLYERIKNEAVPN